MPVNASVEGHHYSQWETMEMLTLHTTESQHKWHLSPRREEDCSICHWLDSSPRDDRHLSSMLILTPEKVKEAEAEATGARINSIRFASLRKRNNNSGKVCVCVCVTWLAQVGERQEQRQFAAFCYNFSCGRLIEPFSFRLCVCAVCGGGVRGKAVPHRRAHIAQTVGAH